MLIDNLVLTFVQVVKRGVIFSKWVQASIKKYWSCKSIAIYVSCFVCNPQIWFAGTIPKVFPHRPNLSLITKKLNVDTILMQYGGLTPEYSEMIFFWFICRKRFCAGGGYRPRLERCVHLRVLETSGLHLGSWQDGCRRSALQETAGRTFFHCRPGWTHLHTFSVRRSELKN